MARDTVIFETLSARAMSSSVVGMSLLAVFETLGDGRRRKGIHYRVAFYVRMQSIVAQLIFQKAFVIYHCRKVIEVDQMVLRGVVLHPGIERFDLIGWTSHCLDNRRAVSHFIVAD